MKKETWLKKYIEKNYKNNIKADIDTDTARIELKDKIVHLFIDDNNVITEKERKRRTSSKEEAPKNKQKTINNKQIKHSKEDTELKKHLSCRFLPGDTVRTIYDKDKKYNVDEVSITRSGVTYKISEGYHNQTTVCDRDLERV